MTISTANFTYIRDLVRQRAAIILKPGKEYLVESQSSCQWHGKKGCLHSLS